jgi:hypothetical protein
MKRAIEYVQSYDKANLLTDPTAEHEATDLLEQAAGFQSDPEIRRAIEDYAMQRAGTELRSRKYGNIKDTSNYKCYDYTCELNGKQYFVEVKGTQTQGKNVILTKGEVEHAKKHPDSCILILVRSVKISASKPVKVIKGTIDVWEKWIVHDENLNAIQYKWTVT